MSKKLTVIGSINADHVVSVPHFAKPGETVLGHNYRIAFGGKGANQAVAAARLGAKVTFVGCIGNDDIGKSMKAAFAQDGIDTRLIEQIEQQMTGIAMIQVAENGENSIVIAAGANGCLNSAIIKQNLDEILSSDCLLMQLETPIEAVQQAAILAKQAGVQVVLNPAPAQALSDELLRHIDIITPNETEAEILTQVQVTDEQSAAKAAAVFHQKGIATVLITLGSKGVYYSQNNQGQIIAGFRVQAVDTTAAGDTFNGGLVSALLDGLPMDQAIRFAHAAAAISVTRQGAQPSIPTKQEALDFLAKQNG